MGCTEITAHPQQTSGHGNVCFNPFPDFCLGSTLPQRKGGIILIQREAGETGIILMNNSELRVRYIKGWLPIKQHSSVKVCLKVTKDREFKN